MARFGLATVVSTGAAEILDAGAVALSRGRRRYLENGRNGESGMRDSGVRHAILQCTIK
jgi:hypothetical protein